MVRIIQNYTLYEVIGEGAYGKVYRAINKVDNKQYAVKVIEVKKFQTNKKLEQCTVHQINILTNIQKNNHIITYFDMLKTQNNFYFVYEYCNGGTLEGMLRKQQIIQEKKALLIFKQLLQAFQVLNKYNIMHRDLKPDNIFFHNGVVKVGDFGFCKSLQKAQMTKTMLGSPIYMAPQILNGQIYSNKADIWSIGVVLYEMLYGYCPFQSNSIPKLIQVLKETELQFPNQVAVSNETKKLLKKILTKDPQKRIQWMQLFQIKISPDGKLLQQNGKISLEGDNHLLKTVREINQINDDTNANTGTSNSLTSSGRINPMPNTSNYGIYSPRNVGMDNGQAKYQPINTNDDKPKLPLFKKNQGSVEEGETVANNSSMRKFTKPSDSITSTSNSIGSTTSTPTIGSNNQQIGLKEKCLKFHQEVVRGLNIARSMGLNNQRLTPLFSFCLLKCISERLKSFRDQNFGSSTPTLEGKQFKQIFEQQIDDVDYQLAMMRNKVEDYSDWKKTVKAKMIQFKNTRLLYELVMFLSGQNSGENLTQNDMKSMIRIKVG